MIRVDISNIWGEVSLPDLLSLEREIFDAHMQLSLPELPARDDALTARILSAAERIQSDSEVFVVVGTGGGCSGTRAAIGLLQGCCRNSTGHKPRILFAGSDLSSRSFQELQHLLEGKDFSVAIVSGPEEAPEPAITARSLRWMLERKYGTDEARYRTYAVTGTQDCALQRMAEEDGWEVFSDEAGCRSPLSAAGLLPMAVAGIDIREVLRGARAAGEEYDLRSFENPVWLYAAVREVMRRQGKAMELLCGFEPCFRDFGFWWQQLFAAEGTDRPELFPVYREFPRDLHGPGQRNFFETLLRFDPPELPHTIVADYRDLDGLNVLADKTLEDVQALAFQTVLDAHTDGGLSVITMECGALNEEKAGRLFRFFELSRAISARMPGAAPLGDPGAEACRPGLLTLAELSGGGQ